MARRATVPLDGGGARAYDGPTADRAIGRTVPEDAVKFGLFFVLQRPEHLTEAQVYQGEMPLMVAADQLSYHSVWIAEHHFADFGVCPSPQVLAASIAGQTKNLRVGMGISLMPLHDPIALAEELAVLDQVSGGRLEVGIGRASSTIEYSGYSVPYDDSRPRVDEGIEILRGAWTNDQFSYQGKFRTVEPITLVPKPRQRPHPPLYLACNSEDTVPIAARLGLPMMASMLVGARALVQRNEIYRQVSAEHGYAAEDVAARIAQTWSIRFVYVDEDERAAHDTPREALLGYLGAALGRYRGSLIEADRTEFDYEEYLKGGAAFVGTPDRVAEQINRFHAYTGVNNLIGFMVMRALDPVKVLRSMELFATKVVPQINA